MTLSIVEMTLEPPTCRCYPTSVNDDILRNYHVSAQPRKNSHTQSRPCLTACRCLTCQSCHSDHHHGAPRSRHCVLCGYYHHLLIVIKLPLPGPIPLNHLSDNLLIGLCSGRHFCALPLPASPPGSSNRKKRDSYSSALQPLLLLLLLRFDSFKVEVIDLVIACLFFLLYSMTTRLLDFIAGWSLVKTWVTAMDERRRSRILKLNQVRVSRVSIVNWGCRKIINFCH